MTDLAGQQRADREPHAEAAEREVQRVAGPAERGCLDRVADVSWLSTSTAQVMPATCVIIEAGLPRTLAWVGA